MFADRIGETCSTSGTADFSLGGAFGTYRTWRSGFATAEMCFYLATKSDASVWEVGYGTLTYGSPDVLSRNTPIASSSGGPKISWSGSYNIYSVPVGLAMKLMQTPLINGVANVPLWIPAGFTWIDYSLGIGTEWVENIYVSGTRTTAASHAEKGRWKIGLSGGETNIWVGSQRQKWTDIGAANKTAAADDIDTVFTFDTSAAARTLTLPQASTTGIGHGFTVGGYGKSQSFPMTVTPNAAESIEGGTNGASRTVMGGTLFIMKWDGANSTWRLIVWSIPSGGYPGAIPFTGRRQTAMGGPVNSDGTPNLLATVSGLALSTSNVSTSAPLVVTAAGGFSYQGQVDRFGISTANISFGTLVNSTTNYLYVDIDAFGVLTGGSTTLLPAYQQGGTYSVTNGQWTFNIVEKVGKLGSGAAAAQVWRVFLGEADTSGGNVSAVRAYAYNGMFTTGYTTTIFSGAAAQTVNHNIGLDPRVSTMKIKNITPENGYAAGDIMDIRDTVTNSVYPFAKALTRNQMSVIWGSANTLGQVHKTSGAASGVTLGSWAYAFEVDRGW